MMIDFHVGLLAMGTLEQIGLLVLAVFVLLLSFTVLVLWLDKPVLPQRQPWKPAAPLSKPALLVPVRLNQDGSNEAPAPVGSSSTIVE